MALHGKEKMSKGAYKRHLEKMKKMPKSMMMKMKGKSHEEMEKMME